MSLRSPVPRFLLVCLCLATVVPTLSASEEVQCDLPETLVAWEYADLLTLDAFTTPVGEGSGGRYGWGERHGNTTIDAGLDIVAVYARAEQDGLRLRVDLLDAGQVSAAELYFALDYKDDGSSVVGDVTPVFNTCLEWDVLIRWSHHDDGTQTVRLKPHDGGWKGSELPVQWNFDARLDFLELSVPASALPGYGVDAQPKVQVLSVASGSTVDSTPCGEDQFRGRAKLVLKFGNALTAVGPGAAGPYEGLLEDWCLGDEEDEEGESSRLGGSRFFLDAIACHEVPAVLTDIPLDTLPGLEYLGIGKRLRDLAGKDLLGLPDTLAFGHFMHWQAQEVDERAIDMSAKARQDLLDLPLWSESTTGADVGTGNGVRARAFYPYEGVLRVEDLRTLHEKGYRGILADMFYNEWLEPDGIWDETEEERSTRLENQKKVQSLVVQVNGDQTPIPMKVFFTPEHGGIDTDSRWGTGNLWNFCPPASDGTEIKECSKCYDSDWQQFLGTDDGLFLYWRRALLDYAAARDQHRLFHIGADIRLTPMQFPEVADRNLRWIAAHPWIEPVTFSQILSEIENGEQDWLAEEREVLRAAETDLLAEYPACGEKGDYNTYHRYFYDGEAEGKPGPRWSCFVPCGQTIEGYAGYMPPQGDKRMGGYCPKSGSGLEACGVGMGPGCKEAGCQDTIVNRTVSALLDARENELADLAWLHYFVTIAEQTGHVGVKKDELEACDEDVRASLPDGRVCSYTCDQPSDQRDREYGGPALNEGVKLQANFMADTLKILRAAEWADCLASRKVSGDCPPETGSRAWSEDLDFDGQPEYVLENDRVFAIFAEHGGRLEYAFLYDLETGPIQVVAPLAQHYGLIMADRCCGEGCSPGAACWDEGDRPLEGFEWGGAFLETIHPESDDEPPPYMARFDASINGDQAIVFRYPSKCHASGSCRLEKSFSLDGHRIEAHYSLVALGDSEFIEINFGLPVDMASMYRRDGHHLLQKIGSDSPEEGYSEWPVGWRMQGRAAARVEWNPEEVDFKSEGHSFTENTGRKYPYNTVMLTGVQPEWAESKKTQDYRLSLELDPATLNEESTPDLVVEWSTKPAAELAPGEEFTMSATVSNQGDAASAPTTLRYLISAQETIGRGQTELNFARVPSLAPRESATFSDPAVAPQPGPGGKWARDGIVSRPIYRLRACVDPVDNESNTDNNCSSPQKVVVYGPDLVVELISRDGTVLDADCPWRVRKWWFGRRCEGSIKLKADRSLHLWARVRNTGNATAAATVLRAVISNDREMVDHDQAARSALRRDPTEKKQATVTVESLPAGSLDEIHLDEIHLDEIHVGATGPCSKRTRWVSLCVDPPLEEGNTKNNCTFGLPFTVVEGSC